MERIELEFKCNNLQCRKVFSGHDRAIVTSCSHMFCVDCADRCFAGSKTCPTCTTPLVHEHDIVVTELNPSEEYMNSIMAGLAPDLIFDICKRGLNFFLYQMSQEMALANYRWSHFEKLHQKAVGDYQKAEAEWKATVSRLEHDLKNAITEREKAKAKVVELTQSLDNAKAAQSKSLGQNVAMKSKIDKENFIKNQVIRENHQGTHGLKAFAASHSIGSVKSSGGNHTRGNIFPFQPPTRQVQSRPTRGGMVGAQPIYQQAHYPSPQNNVQGLPQFHGMPQNYQESPQSYQSRQHYPQNNYHQAHIVEQGYPSPNFYRHGPKHQ